MKLTTNKLEILILEMYSKEQEKKILFLIKKTRNLMLELQVIQGFYPTIINGVYYYDKIEDIHKAIQDSVRAFPTAKKAIMDHYSALQRITGILEEVNQYIYLLETLELEGYLASVAKGMIYGGYVGPITGTGHSVKFDELPELIDTGITFLEDVQEFVPGSLGKSDLGLQTMREIGGAFGENYNSFKNYLDSVK